MFVKIQKKTKDDGDTITLDKHVWMEMLEDVQQSLWERSEEEKWRREVKREGKKRSEEEEVPSVWSEEKVKTKIYESAEREKRERTTDAMIRPSYSSAVRELDVCIKHSAELQELKFYLL